MSKQNKEKKENVKNEEKAVRSPVVVFLGHIDHGKSSLLEAIKKEIKITLKESGGITQHIGAYEVEVGNPSSPKSTDRQRKITFIDTPGHEAFSAMRIRGAKLADIAILVVDASEGVKSQTKEVIEAIKGAKIPLIVALNKIDKPQAQPDKVKGELKQNDILVESLGGKVPSVLVSAKTGQGIEDLLETILILAEVEELKADFSGKAEGIVIESSLDSQKGPIATLLVRNGVLREGDILATASARGKVKKAIDFQGKLLKEVLPSQPAQISGFESVPQVGETFGVFSDVETAQKEINQIEKKNREKESSVPEDKKVLKIIIKADFLGSLGAIKNILENISQEDVILKIIKSETGDINASDIYLAESGEARIFGFKVKLDNSAKLFSHQKNISPKIFDIIYELVDEVKKTMEKMLSPEIKRVDLGKIKIIALFKKKKKEQIIGGRILEGSITKETLTEVVRDGEIIGEGRIKSIQQEKREIPSAGKGKEIGILFQGETDIQENDILVVFKKEKEKKYL